MSFEILLKEFDEMIQKFEQLTVDYPNCDAYKTTLANLQQARADAVDRIGRNK